MFWRFSFAFIAFHAFANAFPVDPTQTGFGLKGDRLIKGEWFRNKSQGSVRFHSVPPVHQGFTRVPLGSARFCQCSARDLQGFTEVHSGLQSLGRVRARFQRFYQFARVLGVYQSPAGSRRVQSFANVRQR